MASDSEDEVLDDLDLDAKSSQPDDDMDDAETADDNMSEPQDEDSASDDDDDGSSDDEGEDDDDEDADMKPPLHPTPLVQQPALHAQPMVLNIPDPALVHSTRDTQQVSPASAQGQTSRQRSLSPARARRALLVPTITSPRAYTVEAVCALPHPVQTHCITASACMTHLLTGSDDGYIRDYDLYASVNGKIFLTQQQRHHCGVVEGIMKAGQLRCWWENPANPTQPVPPGAEPELTPVYSLAMQSDALWGICGTVDGQMNLFTIRHRPGTLLCGWEQNKTARGPVSALALQSDETGFFSGGLDGTVKQWDLHSGRTEAREYISHTAQIVTIAPRPLSAPSLPSPASPSAVSSTLPSEPAPNGKDSAGRDDDAKSNASYDPLFDEEPDAEGEMDDPATTNSQPHRMMNGSLNSFAFPQSGPGGGMRGYTPTTRHMGAPPLTPASYASYSTDVLMTASIDGSVLLWDRRANTPTNGVGRLRMHEKTPPWCLSACWSSDGSQIYAGRRNGTLDVWDVRLLGRNSAGTPRLLKTLRNPPSSGSVSCVVAFPDSRHVACASTDNVRMWNVQEAGEPEAGRSRTAQFKIIPGHHGGVVSQMLIDPAGRFLVTASGNRGWHGESTKTVLIHDIKAVL